MERLYPTGFCKILGLNTDSDGKDGIWVNGKYLIFSSIINRANSILEHLKCRVCGEMLEPATVSNYLAHVVTSFKCTNKNCSRFDHSIYISKCFNWKCNGIIDGRDSKCCPNGWFICPECGSCCSNRIFQQRINHRRELGLPRSLYLERMINEQRGHLENLNISVPNVVKKCNWQVIIFISVRYVVLSMTGRNMILWTTEPCGL